MTVRAFVIGLLAALFIASFGYYNDQVLGLESVTSGHLLPIVVFGGIFVLIAGVNPLLQRFLARWTLQPGEIAVIIVLACAACSIPGRGLMEQFTQILVMPHRLYEHERGWQSQEIMDYVPDEALVDASDYEGTVGNYFQPQIAGDESAGPIQAMTEAVERVPWSAWQQPLMTWLPLIILLAIASVSLAYVLHRQWSHHELLPYPIAKFSASLIDRDEGRPFPKVFYSRIFWIGFGICFFIRGWNAMGVWYDGFLAPIPLQWSFRGLFDDWLMIQQTTWFWGTTQLIVFPLAIAFAYFLRGDVAFTLGISQWAWALFSLPLVTIGISTQTDYASGGFEGWHRAGAYTALTLMLAYAGRHYYMAVGRRALLFWRSPNKEPEPDPEPTKLKLAGEGDGAKPAPAPAPVAAISDAAISPPQVWAARIFMGSTVLCVVLFIRLGLPWTIAIMLMALILMTMIGVSRISAETGLFFVQPRWQAYGALLALFGGFAMGPQALMVAALLCVVLTIDQSQAIMPYLTNGLKLSERFKVSLPKVAGASLAAWLPALLLALVVVLAISYTQGAVNNTSAGWSLNRIPSTPFKITYNEVLDLKAMGRLERSVEMGAVERLFELRPKRYFLLAAGTGFIFVLICSFMRMRATWWPLHPILFLVWATYPMTMLASSLFLGWLLKVLVQRYGGQHMLVKLQPAMIGVIAGEVVGAAFLMLCGALQYMVTGELPDSYRYFPR